MPATVIVLAAGQGKRMRSDRAKVLQPLAGRPLLAHVLDTARALQPARIVVVYGHGGDAVRAAFPDADLAWAEQAEQLGTGHAVACAMDKVPDEDTVLVLCGDVPLPRVETLQPLIAAADGGELAVLTVELADPGGYGRIVRSADGKVERIVEDKDANPEERAIHEVNTGLIAAPAKPLRGWLDGLDADNAQGEYYLTDVIALAGRDGLPVAGVRAADPVEVMGVNDRIQLAAAETALRQRRTRSLMLDGVSLADPERVDLRGRLECGRDVFIDVGAVFEGDVSLGDGVRIGPHCVLRDCRVGAGTRIEAFTLIEQAEIGADCAIGPYARLRPETVLADEVRIGNFVETKKSRFAKGAKANHLSYVGDAEVGEDSNIGAGTVTCNYDGAEKHRTDIGRDVFIGSGSMLVAPLKIGDGATIGAGSVINKDAPPGELTLSRAEQKTVEGWKRPGKK